MKIRLETLLADDKNEIWFEDELDFEKIEGTNRAEIASIAGRVINWLDSEDIQ